MTWVYVWSGLALVLGAVILILVGKSTGANSSPSVVLKAYRQAFDKEAWQDTPRTSEIEIPEVTLTELLDETDTTSP